MYIVRLQPNSKNHFFKQEPQIQRNYMKQCEHFGSSFSFGGKCMVQNMHQSDYYTQPHFFQMIEDNIKLGEAHPSITNGDTKEA